MQPETKPYPTTAQKAKKQPTPMEQWDILAAKVISQELAPKGFKKLTSGSYRGIEIANHSTPGITKATVRKCQSIGAGLVRGFREKVRKELNELLSVREKQFDTLQGDLNKCHFYQFRKKADLKEEITHFRAMVGVLIIAINKLDSIDIK